MPDLDRRVAGLRCRDVLDLLPDFLDGDLDSGALSQVQAHLAGCDQCAKFGGEYASLVERLRTISPTGGEKDPTVAARLRSRLSAILEDPGSE